MTELNDKYRYTFDIKGLITRSLCNVPFGKKQISRVDW